MPPTGPERGRPNVGASGPGTPRKRRRWLKRLLVLAGAALVLAGLVHAPFVRGRVRQYAVAAARDRLDTALSIGALDYNLLTLTFHATDVTAAPTRSPASPFFRAERGDRPPAPRDTPRPPRLLVHRSRPAQARVDPRCRRPLPPSPLARRQRTDAGGRDRPAVNRRPQSADRRGAADDGRGARCLGAVRTRGRAHRRQAPRRERRALPHAGRRGGRHRPGRYGRPCSRRRPDRPTLRDDARQPGRTGRATAVCARAGRASTCHTVVPSASLPRRACGRPSGCHEAR